jgi:CheY-like chemotaxis protein
MESMRFALDAAGVGTWGSDIASGKTEWSDVMERLHGQPAGAFGGTFQSFIEAIHPDDRERVLELIAQSHRDHAGFRVEYRTIWPDASIHWILAVGQPFYDDAGRSVREAGIGLDITVQKELEHQVQQLQKTESIGNVAGRIAHDFNNLLTAILGYSNFLLEEVPAKEMSDSMRHSIEQIRKAGEGAATLTGELLAFSRRQIVQPTNLSIPNGTSPGHSEPAKGTTVKVQLPRVDLPVSATPRSQAEVIGGHETILLVEDDERIRTLARVSLTRRGYVIIEASDAEEALRVAARHAGRLDLLLTDVVMPGMSGPLLAQRFSELYAGVPVLYMSGYTGDAIVHHGVVTPGVSFLQKPFTPATLTRAVREALDTHG